MNTTDLLMLAALVAAGGTAAADERTDRVDQVFADVDSTHSPGAAVAIVQGERVLYLRGYGMANLELGVPITPQTVFDIASVSKQFGAMTAILLEREEVIRLDDDARAFVPELPDFGAAITLRHLVHHTSGIRDWPHVMVVSGVGMGDVISFEHIKKMLFRQRDLNFLPGSEHAYSNTGYNLLAEVMARASGKPFRELADELLFVPLSMTRTHFQDDHTEIVAGRAASYEPDDTGGFRNSTNQLTALASSSLHTTIEDFTRWMINFETKEVGGEEGLARLGERGVLNDGEAIPYAFGIVHGTYRGLPTLSHGGSWRGFRTRFLRFPDQRFSVAVFANFSTADPLDRAEAIADIYLADQLGPTETEAEEAPVTPEHRVGPDALAELAGTYYSPELDTTYTLIVENGALVATHWRNESVSLKPVGPDAFRGDAWWFPEIEFTRGDDGIVTGFGLTGDRVRNLRFDRRED